MTNSFGAQGQRVRAFCSYYNTADPARTIKSLIHIIREQIGQTKPPFDPEEFFPYCPMPIASSVAAVETAYDAFIKANDRDLKIYVNHEQTRARRRFSVAHELAHTFFLPFADADDLSLREDKCVGHEDFEEERLCNIAAAELLMPANAVGSRMFGKDPTAGLIRLLAATFQVSPQAMAIRICEFTPQPLLVGMLSSMQGASPPGLKLLWHAVSKHSQFTSKAKIVCAETVMPKSTSTSGRPFPFSMRFDNGAGPEFFATSLTSFTASHDVRTMFSAVIGLKKSHRLVQSTSRQRRR